MLCPLPPFIPSHRPLFRPLTKKSLEPPPSNPLLHTPGPPLPLQVPLNPSVFSTARSSSPPPSQEEVKTEEVNTEEFNTITMELNQNIEIAIAAIHTINKIATFCNVFCGGNRAGKFPIHTSLEKLKEIKNAHRKRLEKPQSLDTKQRLAHRITQIDLIINHLKSNPNENIEIITIGFDENCTIKTESRKGISQLDTIVLVQNQEAKIIRLSGSYSMQKHEVCRKYLLDEATSTTTLPNLDTLELNNVTIPVSKWQRGNIKKWESYIYKFISENHIFTIEKNTKNQLSRRSKTVFRASGVIGVALGVTGAALAATGILSPVGTSLMIASGCVLGGISFAGLLGPLITGKPFSELPHWLDPIWACTGTPILSPRCISGQKAENNPLPNRSILRKLFVGANIVAGVVGVVLTTTGIGATVGVPLMIVSGGCVLGIGLGTTITRQRRHTNAYYINGEINSLRHYMNKNTSSEAVHGLGQNADRGYATSSKFRVFGMNGISFSGTVYNTLYTLHSLLKTAENLPVLGPVIHAFLSIVTPTLDWIRMRPLTDQFRDEDYLAILDILENDPDCEDIKKIIKDLFSEDYFDKQNYYCRKPGSSGYINPTVTLDSNTKLQLFTVLGFLYHNRRNAKIKYPTKYPTFLPNLKNELEKLKSYRKPLNITNEPDKELVKYGNEVISTASYTLLLNKEMNSLLFNEVSIPDEFEKFIPKLPTNYSLHKTWDKIEHDQISLLIQQLIYLCNDDKKKRNELYELLEILCFDEKLTLTKIRHFVCDIAGGHGHVKDVKKRYLVSNCELNIFVNHLQNKLRLVPSQREQKLANYILKNHNAQDARIIISEELIFENLNRNRLCVTMGGATASDKSNRKMKRIYDTNFSRENIELMVVLEKKGYSIDHKGNLMDKLGNHVTQLDLIKSLEESGIKTKKTNNDNELKTILSECKPENSYLALGRDATKTIKVLKNLNSIINPENRGHKCETEDSSDLKRYRALIGFFLNCGNEEFKHRHNKRINALNIPMKPEEKITKFQEIFEDIYDDKAPLYYEIENINQPEKIFCEPFSSKKFKRNLVIDSTAKFTNSVFGPKSLVTINGKYYLKISSIMPSMHYYATVANWENQKGPLVIQGGGPNSVFGKAIADACAPPPNGNLENSPRTVIVRTGHCYKGDNKTGSTEQTTIGLQNVAAMVGLDEYQSAYEETQNGVINNFFGKMVTTCTDMNKETSTLLKNERINKLDFIGAGRAAGDMAQRVVLNGAGAIKNYSMIDDNATVTIYPNSSLFSKKGHLKESTIDCLNELKLKDVPFKPTEALIEWAEKTLNLKSTEKY